MKILSLIIHPSHSKPTRLLFIFGTQIKIYLMKSENVLSLHWQLCNYHFDAYRSS